MQLLQIVREWPPGYGGIERVAHELASSLNGHVYSFDCSSKRKQNDDALNVNYKRILLPSIRLFDRLIVPLPCPKLIELLFSQHPLLGHLPSPEILFLLVIARLFAPRRKLIIYWHCFLSPSPGLLGFLYSYYQRIALFSLTLFSFVLVTSPHVADELKLYGCRSDQLILLPCCLNTALENDYLRIPVSESDLHSPLSVCFIGRLDSYKRLDWLIQSLFLLTSPWKLSIIGDGPKRSSFQELADKLINSSDFPFPISVIFHGRKSEFEKLKLLSDCDVLVLPSDRCNEAFGIVQLEAMAAGKPALAFDCHRSGMGWVGDLPGLTWSKDRSGLASVLQVLADDPHLRYQLSLQSRHRYLTLFSRRVWFQRLFRLVN